MLKEDNGIEDIMKHVNNVCVMKEAEQKIWKHIEKKRKPVNIDVFMPTLFKYIKSNDTIILNNKKIAIVSHSNYIKKRVYPNSGLDNHIDIEHKPFNNKIIPLKYSYNEQLTIKPLDDFDYNKYQGCFEGINKKFSCDFDNDTNFEVSSTLTENLGTGKKGKSRNGSGGGKKTSIQNKNKRKTKTKRKN